jgi:hypothetical protein
MSCVQDINNAFCSVANDFSELGHQLGEWTGISPLMKQTSTAVQNFWNRSSEMVKKKFNSCVDYVTDNTAHFRARTIQKITISTGGLETDGTNQIKQALEAARSVNLEIKDNEENRRFYSLLAAGLALTSYFGFFAIGETLSIFPPLVFERTGPLGKAPLLVLFTTMTSILMTAAIWTRLYSPEQKTENEQASNALKDLEMCDLAVKDQAFITSIKEKHPEGVFTPMEFANRYKEFQAAR